MKNKPLLGVLFLIIFWSCQDSLINSESDIDKTSITLNTSNKKNVVKVLKSRAMRKNSDSLYEAYPQFMKEIPLEGTNAKITSIPIVLKNKDAYSRMFSLDIDGEQKNVIYNMIPDSSSTSNSFSGDIIVTDLDGSVKSYIEVTNKQFKKITLVEPLFNIDDLEFTTYANCENGCPFNPCDYCDLEEVIVISNPTPDVVFLFIGRMNVPEITPVGNDEEETDPEAPSSGGSASGDDVNNSCPPGMIENNNGGCVNTCNDNFIMNDDFECVEDCPPDYVMDIDGNCKEKPCDKDPVKNPEVAKQENSGVLGGRFGCNRYDGKCVGTGDRDKMHGGLDIKNTYGSPVHAMYDGYVSQSTHELPDAGWVGVLSANVSGQDIKIQYFHLQEDNRTTGHINAGDIIGYQGDSGNLAGAIKKGYTESHVHIKITKDQNGQDHLLDPEDYIGNLSTEDTQDDNENDPTFNQTNCN